MAGFKNWHIEPIIWGHSTLTYLRFPSHLVTAQWDNIRFKICIVYFQRQPFHKYAFYAWFWKSIVCSSRLESPSDTCSWSIPFVKKRTFKQSVMRKATVHGSQLSRMKKKTAWEKPKPSLFGPFCCLTFRFTKCFLPLSLICQALEIISRMLIFNDSMIRSHQFFLIILYDRLIRKCYLNQS